MGNLEISAAQGTQSRPQAKRQAQAKKAENTVILFSSLPANMKTEKVRKFYDKDNSGFLESKNANGENEVDLMQRAFGVDLSKYKSNVVKVHKNKDNISMNACGFDANGKVVVSIEEMDHLNKIYETWYQKDKNGVIPEGEVEPIGVKKATTYDKNYRREASGEKSRNNEILRYYYKDGYREYVYQGVLRDDSPFATYYNNGKKFCEEEKVTTTKTTNLTSGKNKIQRKDTYKTDLAFPDKDMTLAEAVKKGKTEKVSSKTTLNGIPANAKKIGKGRYEVTTEKGKVFYISHDGVNLKPEYVRKNP